MDLNYPQLEDPIPPNAAFASKLSNISAHVNEPETQLD